MNRTYGNKSSNFKPIDHLGVHPHYLGMKRSYHREANYYQQSTTTMPLMDLNCSGQDGTTNLSTNDQETFYSQLSKSTPKPNSPNGASDLELTLAVGQTNSSPISVI